MNRTFTSLLGISGLFSVFLLASASTTGAHQASHSADMGSATCPCASPDTGWLRHQGQRLQQNLPAGQTAPFYRARLQERGWKITDTREETPTDLTYQIAKGDLTAELQLTFDTDTGTATRVVVSNPTMAEATTDEVAERNPPEAEFTRTPREEQEPAERGMAPSSAFSDRARIQAERMTAETSYNSLAPSFHYSDRSRLRLRHMLTELRSLPVGRDKRFYHSAVRGAGYDIPAIYIDTPNQLQFEVEKTNQRAVVTVTFASPTDESTAVYASPLPGDENSTRMSSSALPYEPPTHD
jgi:hypothetical protein